MADHTALKTVAAVGVFVAMILGLTFTGVYWLVSPVYRSEAVVQVSVPVNVAPEAAGAYVAKAADTLKSETVTFPAWQTLRAANYGMQDNREEWLNTLGTRLTLRPDVNTKTISVQYTGATRSGRGASV